jgi:hypothetical protein
MVHDRHQPRRGQEIASEGNAGETILIGAVENIGGCRPTKGIRLLVEMSEQAPTPLAEHVEQIAFVALVKGRDSNGVARGHERVDAPQMLARHQSTL